MHYLERIKEITEFLDMKKIKKTISVKQEEHYKEYKIFFMVGEQEYHIYVNTGSLDMKFQIGDSNFETTKIEELSKQLKDIRMNRFKTLYGSNEVEESENEDSNSKYSYYSKAEYFLKNRRLDMTMDEFSKKLELKTKKEMNYFLSTVDLVMNGYNNLNIVQKKVDIF
jgi:hypothetical protein